jgi:hypothetical protein
MLKIIGEVCQNCRFYQPVARENPRAFEFVCAANNDWPFQTKQPCEDWKEIPTSEYVTITNTQ